jgi:hypothetical protein
MTFGGSDGTTIAAGAVQFSDPVELTVPPLADLAVSIYLPGEVLANFSITGRYARQTNYVSPPGDFTRETVMPVGNLTDQWYFLCGVDVLAGNQAGGVVALGDSLTDGNILDDRCVLPLAGPARESGLLQRGVRCELDRRRLPPARQCNRAGDALATPAPPARRSSRQTLRWRKQHSKPSVPVKGPSLLWRRDIILGSVTKTSRWATSPDTASGRRS